MAENIFELPEQKRTLKNRFGAALGGLGAGMAGFGREYLADLETKKQDDEKKRLTAMVKDAKQAYDFINRGDVNNAQALIQDRVQMINRLGGDPSDTARIGAMIESGNIGLAKQELESFLRPFMPTEAIKASELTDSGQRVTFDPLSGRATAEDVSGFRAAPPRGPTVAIMPSETDFEEEARRGSVTGRLERIDEVLSGSANVIRTAEDINQVVRLLNSGDMNRAEQFLFDKYGTAAANVLNLGAGPEAASALISQLAPQMRPAGSGATSDFEARQYINAVPSAIQSPEGRELTALVFEAKADIEKQRLALEARYLDKEITTSQYISENRKLDSQSIFAQPEIRSRIRRIAPELLEQTPSRIQLTPTNPAITPAE